MHLPVRRVKPLAQPSPASVHYCKTTYAPLGPRKTNLALGLCYYTLLSILLLHGVVYAPGCPQATSSTLGLYIYPSLSMHVLTALRDLTTLFSMLLYHAWSSFSLISILNSHFNFVMHNCRPFTSLRNSLLCPLP